MGKGAKTMVYLKRGGGGTGKRGNSFKKKGGGLIPPLEL